jgi:uncharacterized protein
VSFFVLFSFPQAIYHNSFLLIFFYSFHIYKFITPIYNMAFADLAITISKNFTPIASTAGGAIIGAATSFHLATNGRVTGISGILHGSLGRVWSSEMRARAHNRAQRWKLMFSSGLLSGGIGLYHLHPETYGPQATALAQQAAQAMEHIPVSTVAAAATAGALVGFGTRLGNGCTSGHGVCGLARMSKRSLAAVCTFMGTAFATSYAKNHVPAIRDVVYSNVPPDMVHESEAISTSLLDTIQQESSVYLSEIDMLMQSGAAAMHQLPFADMTITGIAATMAGYALLNFKKDVRAEVQSMSGTATEKTVIADDVEAAPQSLSQAKETSTSNEETVRVLSSIRAREMISTYISGAVFSLGLGISGMLNPTKIADFLDVFGPTGWDPSLMCVMGGAVGYNLIAWNLIMRQFKGRPLVCERYDLPSNTAIDAPLLTGAGIFGVGWALGNFCPGPGFVALSTGIEQYYWWGGGLILGMALQDAFKKVVLRK